MSESLQTPRGGSPQPYLPSGAAASFNMLSSVMGRVIGPYSAPIGRTLHFADRVVGGLVEGGSPAPGREPAQRLYAEPVYAGAGAGSEPAASEPKPTPRRERGTPAQELLTASPERGRGADLKLPASLRPAMALSSPERMFGPAPSARSATAEPTEERSASGPAPAPAGELLKARPTLEPLIAAVEAELVHSKAEPPRDPPADRRDSPQLLAKRGGNQAPRRAQSGITEAQAQKAALEATRQLMEAMRTHATAHSGSDERVTLGDMTLIAFADKSKQMAAATSFSDGAPQHRPIQKGMSHVANPKIREGQHDLHKKIKAMAKLVLEDRRRVEKMAKERFGANG